MRVMVTGATGFLGSHAVAALLDAGHELRLLVRDPAKITRVLAPHGARVVDHVVGDMSDAALVRKALDGCDAVLHTAVTMYGGPEILAANLAGVRNVVGQAAELGLDPILYVSSVGSMFPPPGPVVTADDPVTSLATTYGRSKAEGERYVRELQARGAPVRTLYPGGIWGPLDPALGETSKGLRDALRFGWPITRGGVSIVDVRDLARMLALLLQPGRGPGRYMAGGHFVSWPELAALCDDLTGRRVLRIPAPAPLLLLAGRVIDGLRRLLPITYPLTHEAALFMTQLTPCDSRPTTHELGLDFRPVRETVGDAIRWLHEAGHIKSRHAGQLASMLDARDGTRKN
jgi:nucleoside-diphosphate-sugar epimerase